MELEQYLKYHPFLSSQFEVTACLNYLRCKRVVLNDNLKKLLFEHTAMEIHDYLRSCIDSYSLRRVYSTIKDNKSQKVEDDFDKEKGLSNKDWIRLK